MAKRIIKAIDPKDAIEEKGIVKTDLVRGVSINDTTQKLTVTRSLNHKKGTFELSFKWNMNAITGEDDLDTATLDTVSRMFFYERDQAIRWRDEWVRSRQNPEDPNQLGIGFEEDGEDGVPQPGNAD